MPDGISTGTGFVFAYQLDHQRGTNSHYPFIVTNKHVVENAQLISFWLTEKDDEGKPKIGHKRDIRIREFGNIWLGHPTPEVDVAIFSLGPIVQRMTKEGVGVYYVSIPDAMIPTSEQLDDLDAIEEVTFFGYPIGYFDTANLVPIARRGTTATPPQLDYDGDPVFLIDGSVFPGSSGSPVFVINTGGYSHRGGFVVGNRVHFLGVIASVLIWNQTGEVRTAPIPTRANPSVTLPQMIDLGVVFKASTVVETVREKLRLEGILKA